MLATVPSATLVGVQGRPISVEVHAAGGIPSFTVVGLPDASCREARDRVRAAIVSSGLSWPQKRVTVNLAPGGLRKSGVGLDLPIAVGVLAADGQVEAASLEDVAFLGELGLDGSLRRVPGVLALVDAVKAQAVVVPASAAAEASLVGRRIVHPAWSLRSVVGALRGEEGWPEPRPPGGEEAVGPEEPDLADVRGQPLARFALEVAAAGGHHLLMVGPPGAGKTMLARRLPGLLPPLDPEEALEVTRIHSAAGLALPPGALVRRPPFRAPHHSASLASLIGGGSTRVRPGELSCAHRGVLFLDELGEFSPRVLDTLRQPLEEGWVAVCRAKASVVFPARVQLVAATNPCPCGEERGPGSCRCTPSARYRYLSRISGPLLDRFDLRIAVDRPEVDELLGLGEKARPPEGTAVVARRVAEARALARSRGLPCNAALREQDLERLASLDPAARRLLELKLRQGLLSARGLNRVRRVARTLADLSGRPGRVGEDDVYGALALRSEVLASGGCGA